MKHRSKYRCECCDKDVKTGAIVCSDCISAFYWIHSLFMKKPSENKNEQLGLGNRLK